MLIQYALGVTPGTINVGGGSGGFGTPGDGTVTITQVAPFAPVGVPEPSALVLFGVGGLVWWLRRRATLRRPRS